MQSRALLAPTDREIVRKLPREFEVASIISTSSDTSQFNLAREDGISFTECSNIIKPKTSQEEKT